MKNLFEKRFAYHILFWVVVFAIFTVANNIFPSEPIELKQQLFKTVLFFGFIAVSVYVNLLWLFPKYLMQGKIGKYLFSLLGFLIAYSLIIWPIFEAIDKIFPEPNEPPIANWMVPVSIFVLCIFFVGATSGLKFGRDWFRQRRESKDLANKQLASELKFLRNQINPHFLFNTLNNLYSLTLKKADNAPDVVLKLSELMRYMLYESNERLVSIDKELDYIKNYTALEQLRLGEKSDVHLSITGLVNNQKIAPLLFSPFLENSFKHGISAQVEKAWVVINLEIEEDGLDFEVVNSKPKNPIDRKVGGIGLSNVKRRLQLLYPDKHELVVTDKEDSYNINLKLKFT